MKTHLSFAAILLLAGTCKELVMTRLPKWFHSLAALLLAAMAWSILTSTAPAQAGPDSEGDAAEMTLFVAGLTNPRHIRFGPDDLLYVAEAGTGGDMLPSDTVECPAVDSLFTTPPLHGYMAGFSGRISRILPDGERETVADSLPSARDGFEDSLGPTDIAWIKGTLYALIEGGGCSRGLPDDPAGVIRIDPDGSYEYVADISAFIRANPATVEPLCGPQGDCEPDGVPHTMIAVGRKLYVVETNHNSILRIDSESGEITRIRDLSVQDPAPISMVRKGEHFYLGSFDGLVQKFKRRFGPVRTLEEGFGGIVDLIFVGQRLHVLETSSPETPFAPNDGSVFRIEKHGRRKVIASELNFPVGLALHPDGETLYVSTVGYGQGLVDGQPPEGQGKILRIELKGDQDKGED